MAWPVLPYRGDPQSASSFRTVVVVLFILSVFWGAWRRKRGGIGGIQSPCRFFAHLSPTGSLAFPVQNKSSFATGASTLPTPQTSLSSSASSLLNPKTPSPLPAPPSASFLSLAWAPNLNATLLK